MCAIYGHESGRASTTRMKKTTIVHKWLLRQYTKNALIGIQCVECGRLQLKCIEISQQQSLSVYFTLHFLSPLRVSVSILRLLLVAHELYARGFQAEAIIFYKQIICRK